jgi:hypothetical protein
VTPVATARVPLCHHPPEIVPFEQEPDMNDETRELELSMDEFEVISGAGAIVPDSLATRLLTV